MSVYKKLHQVQAATRSLAADAQGQTGAAKYNYVSGAKLLSVIRPVMDQVGLMLTQEVVGIENTPIEYQTSKGMKTEMFTSVHLRFTWIDTEDGSSLSNDFFANGMNAWDKGLGSALTYGERYYLMKTFHIATDEDDVDALVKPETIKENAAPAAQPVAAPVQSAPAAQAPQTTVLTAIAEANAAKTSEELTAVWSKWKAIYGKDVNFVKTISTHPANPRGGRSSK